MSTERDTEKFNQQPTDQAQNQQPTGQAKEGQAGEFAQQPTGQAQEGQAGQSAQQPSMSGQQQQPSGLVEGDDTMIEQRSDVETGSDKTGDAESGQFVGSQREDSGDYLRKEETSELNRESDSEGSSENFGNNGE